MVQRPIVPITTSALLVTGSYVNPILHESGGGWQALKLLSRFWCRTPSVLRVRVFDFPLPGFAGLKRLGKLPATKFTPHSGISEAKTGMLWLHFEQIHRIAIFTTVSMGGVEHCHLRLSCRSRKYRPTRCNGQHTYVLASIDHPILIRSKLAKRHLGMVFVAERMNSGRQCCYR